MYGLGLIKKLRYLLKMFVRTALFENLMTLSVLLNTIAMGLDSYGNDEETEAKLDFYNLIFTWIFIAEMGLKLLAMGPTKYVHEPMNLLDGSCVILSIFEIVITSNEGGGSLSAFRTARVFRTFRVLRVTRLLRFMRSMALIVTVILRSLESFFYIIILMLLFVFIFALLGMQIFGGQYNFGDDMKIRTNYDSFWIAYVTVFQVMTIENWHYNLFDSMRTSIPKAVTGLYYVVWIFIGNFILLNLLLSIIFDAFMSADEEDVLLEVNEEAEQAAIRKRKEILEKRRARKLKLMGQSGRMVANQKKKKEATTFTGTKLIS